MLKLDATWTTHLLAQRESGMGYQLVEVQEKDGKRQLGTAFNAELIVFDTESRGTLRELKHEQLMMVAKAVGPSVIDIRVRDKPRPAVSAIRETRSQQKSGEAKDAPIEETAPGAVFKRFSAYRDDRRLKADGSWLPGTYATTETDARNVHTGAEAVSRYALPNPAPASWRFTARPHPKTHVQQGVVAPAYGQPGGGVEVIFPDGTQPLTVTGPDKIPDT